MDLCIFNFHIVIWVRELGQNQKSMEVFNLPCLTGSPDSVKTLIECLLCASDSARTSEVAEVNHKEKGKDLRNVEGRTARPW